MKKKKVACLVLLLAVLTGGCAGGVETTRAYVDGLDALGNITVETREEGSGTRSVFAKLSGFAEGTSDRTREDAQEKKSAEEMLSAVEQEPSAIGYVSFGQLREGTKSLCVNGVAAEAESIQDGTYPLSRPFYLAH